LAIILEGNPRISRPEKMEKRTTNGTASADYSLEHNFLQRTVNETKNG
jgi:hypothetical protein